KGRKSYKNRAFGPSFFHPAGRRLDGCTAGNGTIWQVVSPPLSLPDASLPFEIRSGRARLTPRTLGQPLAGSAQPAGPHRAGRESPCDPAGRGRAPATSAVDFPCGTAARPARRRPSGPAG